VRRRPVHRALGIWLQEISTLNFFSDGFLLSCDRGAPAQGQCSRGKQDKDVIHVRSSIVLTHSVCHNWCVALAGSVVDRSPRDVGQRCSHWREHGEAEAWWDADRRDSFRRSELPYFNGSQGKMDASGFCVANALYDPLFVMSANGKVALPMLALSATRTPITRSGPSPFARASTSPTAMHSTPTFVWPTGWPPTRPHGRTGDQANHHVSDEVDDYTVAYNMVIPFSAFPISLAEQQIAYMAHPSSFVPTYPAIRSVRARSW